MEKCLKPSEVASLLGLSRSQIYVLVSKGELPFLRIGTSIRIPSEELERWVREQTQHSNATAPSYVHRTTTGNVDSD